MPHRIGLVLALLGAPGSWMVAVGLSGASAAAWILAALEPDHLKLLILAVGGGCLGVLYLGLKEVVPVYVSARKQLKQMSLDLAEMDQKGRSLEAKLDRLEPSISENKSGLRDLKASTDDAQRKAASAVEIARREAAAEATRRIAEARAEMEAGHKEQIAALNAQLEAYKEEDHQKRHQIRDQLATSSLQAQAIDAELQQARAEIADLKAQLAASDRSKVEAINQTGESVQVIADRMRPPVKVEVPHLETIEPPTP